MIHIFTLATGYQNFGRLLAFKPFIVPKCRLFFATLNVHVNILDI